MEAAEKERRGKRDSKRSAAMRQGDDIVCGECGKEAFVAKKTVMDGWTRKGEVFVCSACGAEFGEVDPPEAGGGKEDARSNAAAAAASLLGLEVAERKTLSASEDEKRFCRDCANFVAHPFLNRCELHGKDVNPMDDCGDFEPKRGG